MQKAVEQINKTFSSLYGSGGCLDERSSLATICIERIKQLGFKPRTQLNIFCSQCSGSIQTFSDKPDEAEIQKFLVNHIGHDCFFGFGDGRKWKIENDGGIESAKTTENLSTTVDNPPLKIWEPLFQNLAPKM